MAKWIWLLAIMLPLTAMAQTTQPVARKPGIDHAVVISIDGLRPDMIFRSKAPHLQALLDQSTYTLWARTTPHSITLPSHVSMLTGLIPRRHGIEWNADLPLAAPVYPAGQTLFEAATKAGYTTAMIAGKSKFSTLAKPGTVRWLYLPPTEKVTDDEVARHAVVLIRQAKPQVLFVHLPGVDTAGHLDGWGSHEQRHAVAEADTALGLILDALEQAGLDKSTLLLVTADHGGAGKTHLPDDARARNIPWIVRGPGIAADVDLTTDLKLVINTEDTFATVCYVMGIPIPTDIDGKPITQIFDPPVPSTQPAVPDEPAGHGAK